MKKYMFLALALFFGFSAQAATPWANEVFSNFTFSADTVETPREIIIKNIVVNFNSNTRGQLATTFNVLRNPGSGSYAKTNSIIELCRQFGADQLVNYTKSDLMYKELILAYDSTDDKNFDFYWVDSTDAYSVSQIVCRK